MNAGEHDPPAQHEALGTPGADDEHAHDRMAALDEEVVPAHSVTHAFDIPPVPAEPDRVGTAAGTGYPEPILIAAPAPFAPATVGDGPSNAPRRWIGGAAIAAIALVALVIGGIMFLLLDNSAHPSKASSSAPPQPRATSATPSPTTTVTATAPAPTAQPPTEATQAQAIDSLLNRSATERSTAGGAVTAVAQCASSNAVAAAARNLDAAAATRTSLVQSLSALPTDKLTGGQEMVRHLSAAWLASAASDRNYSAWAARVLSDAGAAGTCRPGLAVHGGNYQAAQLTDQRATADKRAFLAAWNPLAMRLGLPARSGTGL